MKNLEIQKAHLAVCNKMKELGIPQEIIDKIFYFVFTDLQKNLFIQIRSIKENYSIWWDPSERLKELCGSRGSIQLNYFDIWTIFPQFIEYKKQWSPSFPLIGTIEDALEKDFRGETYHYVDDSVCMSCVEYNFPCLNYCDGNRSACKVIHFWDIKDEPCVKEAIRIFNFY